MNRTRQCLIIDDDEDDQEIFLMCVSNVDKNINCLTADNGVEAISMLNADTQYVPDYIFLDVNMPKMNGVDCLAALRKIKRLDNTKIIMYSTSSENKILNDCKLLGAEDFWVKPNKTSELKKKLYNIF